MHEIIVERHDTWAEVIFNRPARRNAINHPFTMQLRAALLELNADDALRAIVMRGAEGAFCSGLDLKEINSEPLPPWYGEFAAAMKDVHLALMASPKVLIVALQGGAINGGAAFALAGDLMVAGRSSFVQVGEAQFGMPVPRNASWLVLRHGEATAMRFCLMADRVGAEEMLRLGVATEVVDDAAVIARAREIATRLGGFPAEGLRRAKAAVRNTANTVGVSEWFDPAHDACPLMPFVPHQVS